jgi:hypothetical protein
MSRMYRIQYIQDTKFWDTKRLVYKTSSLQNVHDTKRPVTKLPTDGSQDVVEDHIARYFESQKSPLMHFAALLIHAACHREHAQGS